MQKPLIFLFALLSFNSFSQVVFEFDQEKSIRKNDAQVPVPFSQGINSAQIQTMDLTGDGKEEWVIWDINSRQLQVFEKNDESFRILPHSAYFFPQDISGFLVLADFDGDGKKDLFTSTALGIKAYRNTSQGSQISWTMAQNFLRLDGSGNIQANNLDTPLIKDLDGDGDLDLVIFNFASGDFLEYYKNSSIERKGIADIDGFAFPQSFWGNFVFCGCSDFSFGEKCDGRPIIPSERTDENARIQHAGGHSILYRDFSGDGIADLVLGRDECNTLYYLPNFGTDAAPLFTSFLKEIPGFGSLPEFPIFHIGQFIEEELIISLNTNEASFDYKIDFAKSIVKLDESGTQDPNFLQSQLFDLGENARPFFRGNKFGGELWLTANVKTDQTVSGQAFRMAYSGSEFELLESDWMELSEQNLLDLQLIEYTDIQNRDYFLISGTRIINSVPTQLLLRSEGSGFVDFNLSGWTPRRGDQLTFFPFEGKDYLLIAGQNGALDLYEVNFAGNSVTLREEDFLGFVDNPANRNLSVGVHFKTNPDLFTADQTGKLIRIRDFMNSEIREEVLLKIGNENLPTRLGRNTWISVLNPAFEEGPDLILGSRGGGITYLKSLESQNPGEGDFLVKVYPNPTNGPFKVISNTSATAKLISSFGQVILDEINIPANREVEIQTQVLNPGLYFLQLEAEDRQVLTKKILIR
ncbi:FG-GAP-like repeat-containing protein [Algoriphagus sp. A40]|uniref:FG-GAP-like repeat-containing protein n=1 Tax=Algoriphagus sp. A40 TaxID=1945863 RepID=UPI00098656CE|nr:FG-GAP-like repeat-containing protein [Algoriphagus sp. A40]OOG69586.1 hypothetical protein B0E43_21605 [Algoriphagus sp. A40]